MPPVTRLADVCTGHGCFPSRANCQASGDVFVNGRGAHRVGDAYPSHCCFTGDTKFLINDILYSFEYVYNNYKEFENSTTLCFDLVSKKFIETKIEEIIKSTSYEILEIELSNGASFKCTPDHLFLLIDGKTWKRADDLTLNDELMEFI